MWTYPHFVCASADEPLNEIASNLEYINIYRLDTDDGLSGYLDYIASDSYWQIQPKQMLFSAGYHDHALRGQLTKLSSQSGKIDLLVPRSYLSISVRHSFAHHDLRSTIELGRDPGISLDLSNMQAFNALGIKASLSRQRAEIRHQIGNSSGMIPFKWTIAELLAEAPQAPIPARLSFQALVPTKSDSSFCNELTMLRAGLQLSYPLPNALSLSFRTDFLLADARLLYKGEMYGRIDNLKLIATEAGIRKHHDRFSGSLGMKCYHSLIGKDSYLDIWPFTAWDTFLAHRTRIKRFHINSFSPFARLEYQNRREDARGLRYHAALGYNHHLASEDILIRNRKVVLYPFLFSYEDMEPKPGENLDAHMDLSFWLGYRGEFASLVLSAKQILPIDYRRLFSDSIDSWTNPTGKKDKQSGGTSLNLQLRLYF